MEFPPNRPPNSQPERPMPPAAPPTPVAPGPSSATGPRIPPTPLWMSGVRVREAKRRWSVGEIVAWGLIFLLIAFTVVRTTASQVLKLDKTSEDTTFQLTCQSTVGLHLGAHALLSVVPPPAPGGGGGPATPFSNIDAQLMDQLDREAQTPDERLRVAIVAGELLGPEKALERMKTLADDHPDLKEDVTTAADLYGGQTVESDSWASFHKKYGWFADLAAAARKPADDAQRQAVLSPPYRILTALVVLLVCAGPLIIVGMILLVVGVVQVARRRVKLAFSPYERLSDVRTLVAFPVVPAVGSVGTPAIGEPPPTTWVRADRRSYLYGFVSYLGAMLGVALVLGLILLLLGHIKLDPQFSMILSLSLTGTAFALGIVMPLVLGQSVGQWRKTLGLHRGRGVWREMGAGIVGYLAGLPILAAGIVMVGILSRISGLKGSHPINDELNGTGVELIFVFFLACIMAPITEELMFRGALFAHLRERFAWWISAPAVAFVFAIIHPQGWIALPALGALAVVFAGIREWRGSIIGCMTAHALHNGLTLAYAVMLLRQGQ